MAINIRQHITLENTEEVWGMKEMPEHSRFDFYKAFLQDLNCPPVLITAVSDSPIESGLGSSASAAVALIAAIYKLQGKEVDKLEIAQKAYDIEVNKLKMFGGFQDQLHASFGGINVFEFGQKLTMTKLNDSFINRILPSMMLFYLGKNRKSPTIQEGFKNLTQGQIETLDEIKKLTIEGIIAVGEGDIVITGRLLDISWDLKKRSNKGVSNTEIDKVYAKAQKLGAFGGKIMGAGGGGHVLFIVDPTKKEKFKEQIGLKWTDFSPDWNGVDVRILG